MNLAVTIATILALSIGLYLMYRPKIDIVLLPKRRVVLLWFTPPEQNKIKRRKYIKLFTF
jgi:hypothetical protein